MHDTAMQTAKLFFKTYVKNLDHPTVVDIGAQDVNGSLRDACFSPVRYIGVDFVEGKGVDVVLTEPYALPLESESADVVVSSSCFEHSELFWLTFNEIERILRPGGVFYLNVPSSGAFHRYPVDCWRFFPDSGKALETWSKRQGGTMALLESFVTPQITDVFNDFVAVFIKDAAHAGRYPERIMQQLEFENGRILGSEEVLHFMEHVEDRRNLNELTKAPGYLRPLIWILKRGRRFLRLLRG